MTSSQKLQAPWHTWLLMVAAMAATMAVIDWAEVGGPRPPMVLLLPAVLGLWGGGVAFRRHQTGLALASVLWGLMLVPSAFFFLTLP